MYLSRAVVAGLLVTVLSGCLGDSGQDPLTGGDTVGEGAVGATGMGAVEEQAVHHEGMTDRGVCAYALLLACNFTSGDAWIGLDADHPLAIAGEVSWQATSPLSDELKVSVMRYDGNGWVRADDDLRVDGPPPLAFDWDLEPYADEDLAIYVENIFAACAVVVCGIVFPGQEFVLDAVFTRVA